jgi:hypothetical protein
MNNFIVMSCQKHNFNTGQSHPKLTLKGQSHETIPLSLQFCDVPVRYGTGTSTYTLCTVTLTVELSPNIELLSTT